MGHSPLKPEFGTIEIRVFDTPLTIGRAAAPPATMQSLGAWFLAIDPSCRRKTDHLVCTYNRFQATRRFGMEAVYVTPTGDRTAARNTS